MSRQRLHHRLHHHQHPVDFDSSIHQLHRRTRRLHRWLHPYSLRPIRTLRISPDRSPKSIWVNIRSIEISVCSSESAVDRTGPIRSLCTDRNLRGRTPLSDEDVVRSTSFMTNDRVRLALPFYRPTARVMCWGLHAVFTVRSIISPSSCLLWCLKACLKFFPAATSFATRLPLLKICFPRVIAPLFNSGVAARNSPLNIPPR